MTAPVPLVERLAEAVLGARCTACGHEAGDHSWYGPCLASDKNGEFCPCRHSREHVYARALLPVVEQAVTEADNAARLSEMRGKADSLTGQLIKAAAWDEGHRLTRPHSDYCEPTCPNPYRADAIATTEEP